MEEPAFKTRYFRARICAFIHSAFEIVYNILQCLIDMKKLVSILSLKKPSLLHYIQNLSLKLYIGSLIHENESSRKVCGKHLSCLVSLDNPCSFIFLNLPYTLFALPHYFMEWWSFSMKSSWTKEIRTN